MGAKQQFTDFRQLFHDDIHSTRCRRTWLELSLPQFVNYRAKSTEETVFNTIVTALAWHPKRPDLLLLGARGGDLSLKRIRENSLSDHFPPRSSRRQLRSISNRPECLKDSEIFKFIGRGRGSTTTGIVFDENSEHFYVAHASGVVYKRNLSSNFDFQVALKSETINQGAVVYSQFEEKISEVEDLELEFRFSSLNFNPLKNLLVAGDNNGIVHLLDCRSAPQQTTHPPIKVHGGHILNCEFNLQKPDIFVTASVDGKVKLWDLRAFSGHSAKPFNTIKIGSTVNTATFNPSSGTSLLVNDNCDRIHHYLGPNFDLDWKLNHSHLQYQQIATIKVNWHPTLDVAVICRSEVAVAGAGGDNESGHQASTIDLVNVKSGQVARSLTARLTEPGLLAMNAFNCDASYIASSNRRQYAVWSYNEKS